jgi:hypothetical protein
MDMTARGDFEVTTIPQPPDADAGGVGRLLLDKRFAGDLVAASKGLMLARGAPAGWGVYVAIEQVTGTLHGRAGSFVLYHGGTMTSTSQLLSVKTVPESGSGELAGIEGTMTISIVDGRHSYALDYRLP